MIDFKSRQQAFMAHIRDPNNPAPEGIPAERMAVYRELMLNNIGNFVDSGFPVLKSLYQEADWAELREAFFAAHDSHSPLFVDIAAEFLLFLQGWQHRHCDPHYLEALAAYEYLELKLDVMPEALHQQGLSVNDDLYQVPLLLNQVVEIGEYDYPVHQVSEHNRDVDPAHTLLLVYRNLDLDIAFMAINPMTQALLAKLDATQPTSTEALILSMQGQFPQFEPQVIEQGVIQILGQMARAGVVVKPCS
ncbi:DNA-binding domain-containing protein [Ferrimonas sp.]|uniref:HvfC family RiPP maturation protein n=1 Tax=Ferrimonas sp. TaxID=2080861 RepID=UPI003A95BAD7